MKEVLQSTDSITGQTLRLPDEAEALAPLIVNDRIAIGVVPGVNDRAARLVAGFELTEYELGVLANHYLNRLRSSEFDSRVYEQSGSYDIRMRPFADRRLATIREVMGPVAFDAAIAETEKKWDAAFEKAEQDEERLAPCPACGARRKLVDEIHTPGGSCAACDQPRGVAVAAGEMT